MAAQAMDPALSPTPPCSGKRAPPSTASRAPSYSKGRTWQAEHRTYVSTARSPFRPGPGVLAVPVPTGQPRHSTTAIAQQRANVAMTRHGIKPAPASSPSIRHAPAVPVPLPWLTTSSRTAATNRSSGIARTGKPCAVRATRPRSSPRKPGGWVRNAQKAPGTGVGRYVHDFSKIEA